jgi:hypothetical protein
LVVCAAGVAAIVLRGASTSHAQTVIFSEIRDAVPGRFFDAATAAADLSTPNRLRIGFNAGLDPATFKFNDFRASSEAFSHTSAMDTIGFRVDAASGYYIWKTTYSQQARETLPELAALRGWRTGPWTTSWQMRAAFRLTRRCPTRRI